LGNNNRAFAFVTGFFVQPLLPSPLHTGFFVMVGFIDGAFVGFFLGGAVTGFFVVMTGFFVVMTGFLDGAFVGFFLGGDVTGFFVQPLLPSPLHAGFFVVMTGFFDGAFVGFFVQPLLPSPLHTGFFVVGDVVCTDIIFRTRLTFFQST
jgi:hypothetical protein